MRTAREEILGRIRTANEGAPEPTAPEPYDAPSLHADPVELFTERVGEYGATVTRAPGEVELPSVIGAIAERSGAYRFAVARGLPAAWLPDHLDLPEEPGLGVVHLDAVDGVITGCALAIAQTGTIVLDGGPGQGPRRLTLVPDLHVCVVRAEQILGTVPDAVRALDEAARAGRPLTFVSGPSATSDIELERVDGVHGPRTLEVVLIGSQANHAAGP